MALGFNANEILQMAEQIERNGARFYREAAVSCGDCELKERLLELAKMEDGHERTFADMRAALSGAETQSFTFDPSGDAEQYLMAMADANVFDPDVDLADAVSGMSPEEILDVAIDLEKESIVFYLGLRETVSEKAGKDKVEAILKQEMSHVALLRGYLNELA
ncbi:ferritin family protein [Candidatus Bipolaricaulota bacterium]